MISTDTEPEEEDDEDESEVLREGLQRIADSIKPPTAQVDVHAPVTVNTPPRPARMRVQGTYDGRPVDLTINLES